MKLTEFNSDKFRAFSDKLSVIFSTFGFSLFDRPSSRGGSIFGRCKKRFVFSSGVKLWQKFWIFNIFFFVERHIFQKPVKFVRIHFEAESRFQKSLKFRLGDCVFVRSIELAEMKFWEKVTVKFLTGKQRQEKDSQIEASIGFLIQYESQLIREYLFDGSI